MKRSGSTLSYIVAKAIIEQLGLGYAKGFYSERNLEESRSGLQAMADDKKDWYLIKTHETQIFIQSDGIYGASLIYTVRDPREVARSGIEKFDWSEEHVFSVLRSAMHDYYQIIRYKQSYICRFEDFEENIGVLAVEVQSALCVSGSNLDVDLVSQYIPEKKQYRRVALLGGRIKKGIATSIARTGVSKILRHIGIPERVRWRVYSYLNSIDPETLMHKDHASQASREQTGVETPVAAIEKEFAGWLAACGYDFQDGQA